MEKPCRMYPCNKEEYDAASKEAFRLRSEKNMNTRCKITKSGVKLMVKNQNDTRYTEVSFPKT